MVVFRQGHYSDPQCGYVAPGTGGREFEFVVLAGTCGARYVQGSEEHPFLENIIIIQNEPGIQEVGPPGVASPRWLSRCGPV